MASRAAPHPVSAEDSWAGTSANLVLPPPADLSELTLSVLTRITEPLSLTNHHHPPGWPGGASKLSPLLSWGPTTHA